MPGNGSTGRQTPARTARRASARWLAPVRRELTAAAQKGEKRPLEQLGRRPLVGSRRTGAADTPHTQVIQLVPLRREGIHHAAQAVLPGKLTAQHGDELRPCRKGAGMNLRLNRPADLLKFMSRKKCKKLPQNRATMRHGLVPPGFNELLANPLYHGGDSKPLLCGQSIDVL